MKGSRRDQVTTVDIHGEVGTMAAAIWCKEHAPTKTIVHRMNDPIDDTGLNALQLFVQNFKQADLALTGTVRKATLLNQSTKVVNPVSVATPTNRRASTTTASNCGSANGRGSISHISVKVEERQGGISKVESGSLEKTCVTCGIDVSPRWYPIFSVKQSGVTPDGPPISANGILSHLGESQLPNGHMSQAENGGAQIALAVAALHQDTRKPVPVPTEFQCHKCHSKKARKEPSPPPPSPPREVSRPPVAAAPTNVPTPDTEITHAAVSHYPWPQPPSYHPSNSYNSWSRQSPTPQSVAQVNHHNGNHSPHINNGAALQMNGQPPLRQGVPPSHHSPHQNGQNGHIGQGSNGYPPSPHRRMSSTGSHAQNNTYSTYSRPTPQHLTNGGPPPRAPEHPFAQSFSHVRPHSSHGPPHGSPPLAHEPHLQGRDAGSAQSNGARPGDGRINGGASASPSLRNLLS